MSIGSGIGASFGVAPEGTYGTYVAPTRFLKGQSFNAKHVQATVALDVLAAGQEAPADEVVTTTSGTGAWNGQVPRVGFGLILQHLMGGSATPSQQGGTAAYAQTHTLSDNRGKSLTGQVGIPDLGGTVRPYTGLGGKILSAEFSCNVAEALMCNLEIDYRQITEAQSLAAPSYSTGVLPFHGAQMAVKLGTYASEASVSGVKSASIKIARPQGTEAFYAGNAGLKSEPIWNEYADIAGTIEVDMVNKADFIDRFTGHTSTSLVLEWVGAVIAGAYSYTLRFTLPKVYFSGDVPDVGGPDVMRASVPFRAFRDPTNGFASAFYQSIDTSV